MSSTPLNYKIVSTNQNFVMRAPHPLANTMLSKYNISCIQETNFQSPHDLDKFQALCDSVFPNSTFVNDQGILPNSNCPVKHGGVCTIIHSDTTVHSTATHLQELDIPNRYLVIRLDHDNTSIFIHNIYAPAKHRMQASFFSSLPRNFPASAHHIVCGDFNNVYDPSNDAESFSRSAIPGFHELHKWLDTIGLVDPWRIHHPRTVTFSSPKRKNRIDYILISPLLNTDYYKTSGYTDRVNGSDHRACWLHLSSSTAQTRPGPWKLRNNTLDRPQVLDWIEKQTTYLSQSIDSSRNPGLVWQSWKRHARQYLLNEQRRPHHHVLQQVHDATANLNSLLSTSDRDPHDIEHAQVQLQEAKTNYEGFLRSEAFYRQLSQSEKSSRHFFRSPMQPLSKCPIDTAILPDGSETQSSLLVAQAHQRCWGKIFGDPQYTTPNDVRINPDDQTMLLNSIQTRLNQSDAHALDQDITEAEIEVAIKTLPKNKAPGLDGLTSEFYQTAPATFAKILKPVFECQYSRGVLLPDQRKSVVALLHKKGPRNNPQNYRPIALLPVDVKILSKVLTNRIRQYLPKLLHTDQRGFVKDRSISHSLLLLQDVQHHASTTNQAVYATFIDAEKAFDRVNWEYMWKVLETMGFGQTFINWCRLLYHDTKIQLNINGWIQDPLTPTRGVKQGDPLSASLFVLTMETLGNLIRSRPAIGYKIDSLPALTGSYFADDTLLFSTSLSGVRTQLAIFQSYCSGSGAKINLDKTKIVQLNANIAPSSPPDLHIVQAGDTVKYLGLPFGTTMTDNIRVATLNTRFYTQLARWKWRGRTFLGRRLLAQSLVLSQIWYTSMVTVIPTDTIKQWQSSIDSYVTRNLQEASRSLIERRWLRTKGLRVPCVESFIIRQRISLLQSLCTHRYDSSNTFDWFTLPLHYLQNLTTPFSRPNSLDFLWLNLRSRTMRSRLTQLPSWWSSTLELWTKWQCTLQLDHLDHSEQLAIYCDAPLWNNRYPQWHYQPNPSKTSRFNLSPSSTDDLQFRSLVAQSCNIYSLQDVFLTDGRWPTQSDFIDRVTTSCLVHNVFPSRRRLQYLYRQLSQLYDRLVGQDTLIRTDGLVQPPWSLTTTKTTQRFPRFKPRTIYQALIVRSAPRSRHPLDRHEDCHLDHGHVHTTMKNLRRFVTPVHLDVLFRVWWRILPLGYFCWNPNDQLARMCPHGCTHVETASHVFFSCQTAAPLWNSLWTQWSRFLRHRPTWSHIIESQNLDVKTRWQLHHNAIRLIWRIQRCIVLHYLWTQRNDLKHRGISAQPPIAQTRIVATQLSAHLDAARRTLADEPDLLSSLQTVFTALQCDP